MIMRIPNSITALTACLLAMAITACASGPSADEELLECQGSCDTVGSLSIPTRWVPVGGSIRAQTAGAPLQVEPSTGVSIEARSGNRWIATFASPGYFTVKSGSDRMSIRVADDGLGIELVSPAPGAFVEAAEGSSLVVRGRVSDSLGANIDHVTVDSKRIEVSAGESSVSARPRMLRDWQLPARSGVLGRHLSVGQ